MFAVAGLVIGAFLGAWRAKRRGGDRRDMFQYAASHAILFALIGLFLTLIIHRALV
ncbi:hypothetical protein SAMN06297129_2628 [Pseudooceanicola antarcticus]|uniref:PEP-CTERM protein-sorting domain-containing protein n=1 Tax=Pseudooceanicola antarcticus TaxID=1247613 RepID=A0A285J1P2_9RHOB|nr:hypothetical protein [Pseudooceanicola antarcticus]SNY53787.1 hypothetical protein SAMN06297129_2628 [Pseudooceanicola antarcticus]